MFFGQLNFQANQLKACCALIGLKIQVTVSI